MQRMQADMVIIGGSGVSQFNDEFIELIKLKAEALDIGHLKLATWGSKKHKK